MNIIDFAHVEVPIEVRTNEFQEGIPAFEVDVETTIDVMVETSENLSDSQLPDAQLRMEQEDAQAQASVTALNIGSVETLKEPDSAPSQEHST